jgi:catechol 2,3-dioxygenase-like lactoylglutathione lyase family enzyme
MMADLTRRQFLIVLSAGTAVARPFTAALGGQAASPRIRVQSLNHFGIAVSDPKRSIDFYQGLFGLPVQARTGENTILRIGSGPQCLSIGPLGNRTSPSIWHYCLGVQDFDLDSVIATLAAHGVTKADDAGPMKVNVTVSGDRFDLLFGDPDGVICQLQDVSYCGGSGRLGNQCSVAAASKKGLISVDDLNHLTISSSDPQRSNKFYQGLFGFSIRSYQGPTAPTLAVGTTVQFLMFSGGGAGTSGATPAPPRAAGINHACLSLRNFKPDEILKTLESFGLKPRGDAQGPVGPLRYYVSMRMENRGGAPGGTPELYFTDPDGLVIQLQDTSYCGGSGFLGNECRKA